jgi:TPR repeat protein
MYAMEFVLKEDYKTAKKYALIGANGGNLDAMGILGVILWKSDRDIPQAKIWLNRAAKDNNISAINFLGDISAQEDKNYLQALEWYKKSEKLGSLQGGFLVGAIYYEYLRDSAAACTAFKNVLTQTEKLKKSLRYEDDMEQWVVKSSESIPYVCAN